MRAARGRRGSGAVGEGARNSIRGDARSRPLAGMVSPSLVLVFFFVLGSARAQDKVTYEDQVLPILRNKCLQCHNADKQKADLNLATFSAALKGSGNGVIVEGGDPDNSKMFRVIMHTEEPNMPPKDKLPDAEIEVIRRWIAGGLLETSGSKAIVSNKPKVNLALGAGAVGRPEGPPPMPEEVLALDPYVETPRASIATALAVNPWSPLVAVGGQHQVLLYNTDTLRLEGVVPFLEGYPHDVKFSANGKLLVIGGGRGANLGVSSVWDITSGQKILTVGDDLDEVLATDISADQKFIAHGGPDRLVRIFSTASGRLLHKIKKHTDWVTAVKFSPDGKYLATGDRNGGLQVWESANGGPIGTLNGHTDRITGLAWANTNILISASEDGKARIWNTDEVRELKNWQAHGGGVLFLGRTQEGLLVTCGRDRKATLWDANGGRQRDFGFPGDLPSTAVPSHDGKRVIGTDWNGLAYVWDAADGKEVGRLALNPDPMAQQLAVFRQQFTAAQGRLTEARGKHQAAERALAEAQAVMASKEQDVAVRKKEVEESRANLERLEQKEKPAQEAVLAAAPEEQKAEVQAKLAALGEEIKNASAMLQTVDAAVRQAEDSLKAAREGAPAKQIEERQKQVVELAQVVAGLEKETEAAQREVRTFEVRAAFAGFFKSRETFQASQARREELLAQMEAVRGELESTRSELLQAEQIKVDDLKMAQLAVLEKARQDRAGLQVQLAEADARTTESHQALAQAEEAARGTEQTVAQRKAMVEQAQAAVTSAEGAVQEKRKQMESAQANLNDLIAKKENPAQERVTQAAQALDVATAEKARADQALVTLSNRIQQVTVTLAMKRAAVQESESAAAAERAKVEAFQPEWKAVTAQAEEARVNAAMAKSDWETMVSSQWLPASNLLAVLTENLAVSRKSRQVTEQLLQSIQMQKATMESEGKSAEQAAREAESAFKQVHGRFVGIDTAFHQAVAQAALKKKETAALQARIAQRMQEAQARQEAGQDAAPLLAEVETLRRELTSAEAASLKAAGLVSEQGPVWEAAHQENDTAQRRWEERQSLSEKLKARLNQLQAEKALPTQAALAHLETTIQTATEAQPAAQRVVTALQAEAAEAGQRWQALATVAQEIETRRQTAEGRMTSLTNAWAASRVQVVSRTQEVESIQSMLDQALKGERPALVEALGAADKKLSEATTEKTAAVAALEVVQKEVTQARQNLAALTQATQAADSAVAEARTKLEAQKQLLKQAEEQSVVARQLATERKNALDQLQQQRGSVAEALARAEQETAKQETVYQTVESRQAARLADLKQRVEAQMGRISGWEKERLELESLLVGQEKDVAVWQGKFEALKVTRQ